MYGNCFVAALNDRFFRPDEPMHELDTEQALRTDGIPPISFSPDNNGREQSAAIPVDLRVRTGERRHLNTVGTSTLMSMESYATTSVSDSVRLCAREY